SHLLADLRDDAQEGRDFFADERFAERFMLGAEHPGQKRHPGQHRHGNEDFPPHARPSDESPAAGKEDGWITMRSKPRLTPRRSPASLPPRPTPIVSTLGMIPRCSL